MAKNKSKFQKSLGKLISAIQKEWSQESGLPEEKYSENVLNLAHDIYQLKTTKNVRKHIGNSTIRQYLGDIWVQSHPNIKPTLLIAEKLLNESKGSIEGECDW